MTPLARPVGGDRACASCAAPLASDQRWCLECGARRTGADPVALLFAPGGPLARASAANAPAAGADTARSADGAASLAPAAGGGPRPPRSPQAERRRRAAAPLACAALVGLFVVTGGENASLNQPGQPPFTVVLPQFAQPAPVAVEEPADEAFAESDVPLDASLPADEVVEEPAAEEPAGDEPSDDGDDDGPAEEAPSGSSPVKHVFLIVLASTDVGALATDEQAARYLGGTLAKSGTLLTGYRAVARGALANRIALVSGQGPTAQTLADCTAFADVRPADPLDGGQTGGDGCVYGYETGTLADQLNGAGKSWRAYLEPAAGAAPGADGPAARAAAACTPAAEASRRNPFAWFRGLAEADDCDERSVPLSRLAADLEDPDATPALSFIASDAQLGSADADALLERVVPQIQNSLAYANGGLIVITSDQPPAAAPAPAPPADPAPVPPAADPPAATTPAPPPTETTPQPPTATTPTTTTPAPTSPQQPTTATPAPLAGAAATAQQPWPATYPNVGDAAAAGAGAPVGALLISPFTPAGRRDDTPASHFTLLRTLATIYGVDPLGYAAAENVAPLPDALFEAQQ